MPIVSISPPTAADREPFLAAVTRSRTLHGQWVAPPSTAATFDDYLLRVARPDHAGFLVRLTDAGAIAGVFNIGNIIGEPLSSGFLGFYAFEPHANQGYMKAGLRLVLARAFGTLALHRLETNIQPANQASIALVRSCGFRREGFSPKYLRIAGEWRDHERWAILANEFRLPSES